MDPIASSAKRKSALLKIALFATGLSGIVAEYILSTLASYFLGDSVFQWTMILSLMLFSMGLGSRITQFFKAQLLEKFIVIEFTLSLLVSFSAQLVYLASGYTMYNGVVIYVLCIAIGLMIGLEIPLVTRLNDAYESLRINIASVMEKDYYGSLLGGVFFAFVGLPYLGMTYTPFVLGGINFFVAILLLYRLNDLIISPLWRRGLWAFALCTTVIISLGGLFSAQIITFAEQKKYKDKVIYADQSKYQKIVITQWKEHYWLFLNGNQQFSTLDEAMYHEPLVHPPLSLSRTPYDVLILGGGDGCAVREVLKYPTVRSITVVDLDQKMTQLAQEHPVLLGVNQGAFADKKVKILNQDAFTFLAETQHYYDAILIDLPDPRTIELNRLYTREMYTLCYKQLRPQGVIITQAGSPYYSTKAFECVFRSMEAAGFEPIKMHNQILTLGEWGWVMAAKHLTAAELKQSLPKLKFDQITTRWLNQEAMSLMTSFGKETFFLPPDETVEINTIHNPVLYRYYLRGTWDLY